MSLKKYTQDWWIARISDDEVREKAQANLLAVDKMIWPEEESESARYAIDNSFNWSDSNEGYDYWNIVSNKLRSGELPLLPEPEDTVTGNAVEATIGGVGYDQVMGEYSLLPQDDRQRSVATSGTEMKWFGSDDLSDLDLKGSEDLKGIVEDLEWWANLKHARQADLPKIKAAIKLLKANGYVVYKQM